uniref:Uncharacterized protein n=1 Tax=Cacopsylla melanoneura TaxID=428564 RepID=A0A8D8YGM2_9HEMI
MLSKQSFYRFHHLSKYTYSNLSKVHYVGTFECNMYCTWYKILKGNLCGYINRNEFLCGYIGLIDFTPGIKVVKYTLFSNKKKTRGTEQKIMRKTFEVRCIRYIFCILYLFF